MFSNMYMCLIFKNSRWGASHHLPIRSGHLAAALHSGRRALLPGWRRQRFPRHLHHPRCWSRGQWSLCGAQPSWVPCKDSWDSTSALGSRWVSAFSGLTVEDRGGQQSDGAPTKASEMPCSGKGAQRLLELHRGMVLYLGSLVPNSVLTEEKPHCMLTHTLFLSVMHRICTNTYWRTWA